MVVKTSKVSNVQGNGTWQSRNGLMYKFDIWMENGDKGEYSSLKQDQNKFIVGDQIEYEFHDGQYPKIKPVYKPNQNGSKKSFKADPKQQESIEKQSCLRSATIFHQHSSVDANQVVATADIFYNWLNSKPSDAIKNIAVNHPQHLNN